MAMRVLERQNVYDPDLLVYRTALGMVRSASLNCYIFDVRLPCRIMASADHLRLEQPVLLAELKHSSFHGNCKLTCTAGREK